MEKSKLNNTLKIFLIGLLVIGIGFLVYFFTKNYNIRAELLSQARSVVPQTQQFIEGTFWMATADPIEVFSTNRIQKRTTPLTSTNWYYLTTSTGKQYELKFLDEIELVSGTKIKVPANVSKNGTISISPLVSKDIQITQKYPYRSYSHMIQETRKNRGGTTGTLTDTTQKNSVPVAHKMLVVPVQVAGTTGTYKIPSKENIYNRIFNGPINDFFKENSYNKMTFVGDVANVVTTNKTCSQITNGNLLQPFNIPESQFTGYDHVLYLAFNCPSIGNNFAGYGVPPFNGYAHSTVVVMTGGYTTNEHRWWNVIDEPIDAPLTNWTFFDQTLSHELGHALGLGQHANSLESCTDVKYNPTNCIKDEYGNRYDAMGGGLFSTHFNAGEKYQLGWLEDNEILTVTQNGQYQLYPVENPNGVKLIKIHTPSDHVVYLDKRKVVNYDNITSNGPLWNSYSLASNYMSKGVFVYGGPRNLINTNTTTNFISYDSSNQQYDQKPLMPDEILDYEYLNLKIKNVASSEEFATVKVTFIPPNPAQCQIDIDMVDDNQNSALSNSHYGVGYEVGSNQITRLYFNEASQTVFYQAVPNYLILVFRTKSSISSPVDCSEQVQDIIVESNFKGVTTTEMFISNDFVYNLSGIYSGIYLNSILEQGYHDFYVKVYNANTNEVYFYKDFHINLCNQQIGCPALLEED